MNRTEKLINDIANLNEHAGEIGAGMLAHIISEARKIQEEEHVKGRYVGTQVINGETFAVFENVSL